LSGENYTPELRFGDCAIASGYCQFSTGFLFPSFHSPNVAFIAVVGQQCHQPAVTHLLYVTQLLTPHFSQQRSRMYAAICHSSLVRIRLEHQRFEGVPREFETIIAVGKVEPCAEKNRRQSDPRLPVTLKL
jgi:hypothetical protein